MPKKGARIVFDLDGTIIGTVLTESGATIALRPGILEYLKSIKAEGNTLILWTFGNREWWRTVRRAFPALGRLFSEVYTRDELPGHITTGRGRPEPIKDIRVVGGDILIDNDPAHREWAKRHGLGKRYFLVPTFGIRHTIQETKP